MFALCTYRARRFLVETEHLTAKHILPLFQEITIMDDDLKLKTKKARISRLMSAKERFLIVHISLDIGWCSSMRKASTMHIYEFMDNVFGYSNLFKRSHTIFEDSWKYIVDGMSYVEIDPLNLNNIGCFQHFYGGFEGLKQTPWTIFTVNLINFVIKDLGIRYYL
ncbi:Uncharacterised protein at_DN0264 [Pycnogonum litorale]